MRAARALAASADQDADFRVADMTATGLAEGSVDAVLGSASAIWSISNNYFIFVGFASQ